MCVCVCVCVDVCVCVCVWCYIDLTESSEAYFRRRKKEVYIVKLV